MLVRVKSNETKREVEVSIIGLKYAIDSALEQIETHRSKLDFVLEKVDEINNALQDIQHDRDNIISKQDIMRYIKDYSNTLYSVNRRLWDFKYSIRNPRWINVNEEDSNLLVKVVDDFTDKIEVVDNPDRLVETYSTVYDYVSELAVQVEE